MDNTPAKNNNIDLHHRSAIKGYHALEELALDLHLSWSYRADNIWERLDPALWEITHNPWIVLQTVYKEKLVKAFDDPDFSKMVDEQLQLKREQDKATTWFKKNHAQSPLTHVAYFSMEYMLSEALPIYSGGLGNVAGDQLKAASDLGVPVVAVGLLYQQGYFRQAIDKDGCQELSIPIMIPDNCPSFRCANQMASGFV